MSGSASNTPSVHRSSQELLDVMQRVGEAVIYMPVQRVNHNGIRFGSDMVAAIPVPLWEELVARFDAFDTGWHGDET